jgi:hypothetical protein
MRVSLDGFVALDNPKSKPSTLKHARWLEKALEVVVSRTMKSTEWENSLLVNGQSAGRLRQARAKSTTLGEKIAALRYERVRK